MTWGISDFIDEKTGEADGKYSISLNFPNNEYKEKATTEFLEKLQEFENQILDDAVKNSELWWGEEMSREICKHSFYPILKYPKVKGTTKIDYTKSPSIRAKVPFYQGKWGVELYDAQQNIIFPCEDPGQTPIDFVPKQSNIACVLQCGGIWIGGKGWGITWKLVQCVVKKQEIEHIFGKCHIQLSVEDQETIETQEIVEDAQEEDVVEPTVSKANVSKPAPIQTQVEDSDDEELPAPVVAAPVVEEELPPKPVKKIIKKPVVEEAQVEVAVQEAEPVVVKKKVVKKKVP